MAESGGSTFLNPELKINLAAIKKCDKFVVNILDNASQVALYKFKSDTQAWEKTEVEGALFVYSRSTHPRTSFFIMNRLKIENLMEPITAEMEFKLQEPFLLYRNKANKTFTCTMDAQFKDFIDLVYKGDIFGIWFYDRGECSRLGQLMIRLSTGVEELKSNTTRQTTTTTKEKQQTAPASNGKVNLLQLLAKAQEKYEKGDAGTSEESAPSEELKPVQTKQQQVDDRSQSIPSPDPSSTKPRAQTLPVQYRMSPTRQRLLSGTEKPDQGLRQPSPITSVQDAADSARNVTLASVKVPIVSESQPQENSPKPVAQRKLFQSGSTATSLSQESPQKQSDSASGSGTSLMSPLAFQASARTSSSAPGGATSIPTKPSIAPLQMEQFVQAFTYLVKNDGDFVQRLHEAYVKTLQGN